MPTLPEFISAHSTDTDCRSVFVFVGNQKLVSTSMIAECGPCVTFKQRITAIRAWLPTASFLQLCFCPLLAGDRMGPRTYYIKGKSCSGRKRPITSTKLRATATSAHRTVRTEPYAQKALTIAIALFPGSPVGKHRYAHIGKPVKNKNKQICGYRDGLL